MTEFIVVI